MKYMGMPWGMWLLFKKSFQKQAVAVLGFDKKTAAEITAHAKLQYKEIIRRLPEFEKGDRFKMNLVNCALFSAFYLNMPKKPSLEKMTEYYDKAMMISPVKWFCRMSGKNKFTENDIQSLKETAALRAADRNPYSWNMEFYEYEDGSGYEARFTKCGICTLLRELGIGDVTPAMCRLDYSMSEAGGASQFIREYTLASGGPYCDCGYHKLASAERTDKKEDKKANKSANKSEHLPIYGVGPIYGICIVTATVIGIVLSCAGILPAGKFPLTKIPFLVIGVLIVAVGFLVWFKAAFKIDKYIVSNKLCTGGIYGIVRNPCYSGIMLMCTGALFIANNLFLLILPFMYWSAMTILMKQTEEKWLYKLYGKEYAEYCKRVNRCIPWFARKK